MITNKTRAMSYMATQPDAVTRRAQILATIGDKKMTAREIAKEMKQKDMNYVRPRITELVKEYHELIECGEVYDMETNRTVTLFRKTTKEEKKELDDLANKKLVKKMVEENMDHIPIID